MNALITSRCVQCPTSPTTPRTKLHSVASTFRSADFGLETKESTRRELDILMRGPAAVGLNDDGVAGAVGLVHFDPRKLRRLVPQLDSAEANATLSASVQNGPP